MLHFFWMPSMLHQIRGISQTPTFEAFSDTVILRLATWKFALKYIASNCGVP
jgi:hypothetical protein